jgi:hypothetical protein
MSLESTRTLLASLALLPLLLWPAGGIAAEPTERVLRIGLLSLSPPLLSGSVRIRTEPAELGYVEGANMVFQRALAT